MIIHDVKHPTESLMSVLKFLTSKLSHNNGTAVINIFEQIETMIAAEIFETFTIYDNKELDEGNP